MKDGPNEIKDTGAGSAGKLRGIHGLENQMTESRDRVVEQDERERHRSEVGNDKATCRARRCVSSVI